MQEFIAGFFDLVEKSENIIITSHFSPDGDSIGSVLSVYRIITDKYKDKNVRIVYSNQYEESFSKFENFGKIEWVDDVTDEISDCNLLIALDCSLYTRFTRFPERVAEVKNTICIDHHASKPDKFTLSAIEPSVPSCAQLIFSLFEESMNLDKGLAEVFLLGIMTDTGNFVHIDSSQADTLLIAYKLASIGGINLHELQLRYSPISKREFTLLQEYVRNVAFGNVEGWPDFLYTFIERKFIEEGGYTNNETLIASKAFISKYLISISGYSWGFVFRPKTSFSGVSMRSTPGSVNVRDIVERMQIGGGHDRAAAGIFKREGDSPDPHACIEKILEWLKNNKPVILN